MGIILKEMKQGYQDLLLHKANKEIVCAMPVDFLTKVTRGIRDIDSIEITINKIVDNNKEYPFYEDFKIERLISLDGEFFIIKECTENKDEKTKTIKAYGFQKKLEKNNIVLTNIGIMLNDSDYSNGNNIIINLNEYMYQETGWKFGHIDEEVLYSNYTKDSTYLTSKNGGYILTKDAELIEVKQHFTQRMRWLEDIDTDWFTFISENISEEFECVPIFDNTKQEINLYYIDNFGENLGLILSYDNYIKSLEVSDNSSDIITRLTLIGNEDKCIVSDYLPTGKNYVENYSYFIKNKEMSDELILALEKHDELIEGIDIQLRKLRKEKSEEEKKLTDYKTQWFFYIEYNKQLKEIEANYRNTGNTDRAIEIALQLNEGMDKEAVFMANTMKCEKKIEEIDASIQQLNILCNRESCIVDGVRLFSDELLAELKNFIYYDTYSNDAFYDAQEIISCGKRELELRCCPTRDISIDIESFLNKLVDNEFRQHWNGVLGLGDIVVIYDEEKADKGEEAEEWFYLVGYEYSLKDGTLQINLSNKKLESNTKKVILDVLKNAKEDNKQMSKNRRLWNLLKENKININE